MTRRGIKIPQHRITHCEAFLMGLGIGMCAFVVWHVASFIVAGLINLIGSIV